MKSNKFLIGSSIFLLIIVIFLSFKLLKLSKQDILKDKDLKFLQEDKVLQAKDEKKDKNIYENTSPNIVKKEILFFKGEDFKSTFTEDHSQLIFDEFTGPITWETLGFSISDSKAISNSLVSFPKKTKSIIMEMINYNKDLKLILIPKKNQLLVNYGTAQDQPEINKSKLSSKPIKNKGVKNLDIEIDYQDLDVSIEYYLKDGLVEVSIQDELNKINLYGDEAKSIIENDILTLNFPATREFAIEELLKALSLKKSYNKMQIEIDYESGESFNYQIENK